METAKRFCKCKSIADLLLQPFWTVTYHIQPAALGRAVERKGRHDQVSAGWQGGAGCFHVTLAVFCLGKKMEDCAVMPYIVLLLRGKRSDVCSQPFYPV